MGRVVQKCEFARGAEEQRAMKRTLLLGKLVQQARLAHAHVTCRRHQRLVESQK